MRFVPTLAGGALGAAILFFTDPQSGHRRRKQTAERSAAMARRSARLATRVSHGAVAEGNALRRRALHSVAGRPRPVASEEMLADRVRSELFRNRAVPKGSVNINVERDGVVVLRGEVQRPEQMAGIEARVRSIPGVRDVENLLHQPGTPARMHNT
jgi:osmotically-inducible protein OsmY